MIKASYVLTNMLALRIVENDIMKILLHSSKTMKPESSAVHELSAPQFVAQAEHITKLLRSMDTAALSRLMAINDSLAQATKTHIDNWRSTGGTATALTFRGDIYSGLAAGQWTAQDATFAQQHLLILSGLYGILRPFDAVWPYRLEMGYKLDIDGTRLDAYWRHTLDGTLDPADTYVNLTAAEYFTVVKPQLSEAHVISPKFLTVSPKTGKPVFVTVHAKIARGSFANWLITHHIDDPAQLLGYDQLGYAYDATLSTQTEPVFVCRQFGGLGLSVRLK